MKKNVLILGALLLIPIIYIFKHGSSKESLKPTEKVFQVEIIDSKAVTQDISLSLSGVTQGVQKVTLQSEVKGLIDKLHVKKGSLVKKGDLLISINAAEIPERITEGKAALAQKELELKAGEKLAAKGFLSPTGLLQRKAEYKSAKASLDASIALMKKTQIVAPFDGLFDYTSMSHGDFVDSGTVLGTVVALNPLKVTAWIGEQDLKKMKKEMKCSFPDYPSITGKVSFISLVAQSETRSFGIEILADNPQHILQDGQSVTLLCSIGSKSAHKISPALLSLNDQGIMGIKTIDVTSKVQFYPIEIVSHRPDALWVDGLPPQAKIISVGHEYVNPGQIVKGVLASAQ
jgi:multidrug efflux system membrane fusion protein